jgi:hypothetical protein
MWQHAIGMVCVLCAVLSASRAQHSDCLLSWLGLEASQDNKESSKKTNNYQLLYPYGLPPDDGL